MTRLITILLSLILFPSAFAQDLKAQFIEVDLSRKYGFFSKSPAVLRAMTVTPTRAKPKEAILFFIGWPGLLWLPEKFDPQKFLDISKTASSTCFGTSTFSPPKTSPLLSSTAPATNGVAPCAQPTQRAAVTVIDPPKCMQTTFAS